MACRWLRKDGESNFEIEDIPKYKFGFVESTICNWQDKFVFMVGKFEGIYGFNVE